MKWQRGEGLKVEEQAASTFSSQNMERDAPWTAWDRMSQPHEEAGSKFKIQNSKFKIQNLTFHLSPPRSFATLAALR
jgi:hypothetical protein